MPKVHETLQLIKHSVWMQSKLMKTNGLLLANSPFRDQAGKDVQLVGLVNDTVINVLTSEERDQ